MEIATFAFDEKPVPLIVMGSPTKYLLLSVVIVATDIAADETAIVGPGVGVVMLVGVGASVTLTVGVTVGVGVGVVVGATVGAGVVVSVGVTATVGVGVAVTVSVGVTATVGAGVAVGVTVVSCACATGAKSSGIDAVGRSDCRTSARELMKDTDFLNNLCLLLIVSGSSFIKYLY